MVLMMRQFEAVSVVQKKENITFDRHFPSFLIEDYELELCNTKTNGLTRTMGHNKEMMAPCCAEFRSLDAHAVNTDEEFFFYGQEDLSAFQIERYNNQGHTFQIDFVDLRSSVFSMNVLVFNTAVFDGHVVYDITVCNLNHADLP